MAKMRNQHFTRGTWREGSQCEIWSRGQDDEETLHTLVGLSGWVAFTWFRMWCNSVTL